MHQIAALSMRSCFECVPAVAAAAAAAANSLQHQ
jgi:hypothetical protein